MSLPIYQRVAVTDAGDIIPGAEYTVINENTGVAAPIYSDRTGATLLTAPYFADSAGTIQFFIAQGTTFRVAASGGVGTYTDRYVYGVAEAVLVQADGNVGINTSSPQTNLQINSNGGGSIRLERIDTAVGTGDSFGSIEFSQQDLSDQGAGVVSKIESVNESSFSGVGGLAFSTGNATSITERMRIDSAGNLLVATTDAAVGVGNTNTGLSLANSGYAAFSRTGSSTQSTLFLNKNSNDGKIINFSKDGTTVGSIGTLSGDLNIGTGNAGLRFNDPFGELLPHKVSTNSGTDATVILGSGGVRFKDIYLANAPIVTSDRNQKQDILEITTAEAGVAKACKGLMRSFRLKSAVDEKGEDARIHFGIIAQDLQDAFTAEGLDAGRYAMFMSDTWWETKTEIPAVEAVDEVTDEDGNVTTEAVEAKDAYTRTDKFDILAEAPAGATEHTRLGVRYTELLAFIIAAI